MTRILFVDDQQQVLDSLRDALRPQRHEWEMLFASSGADALAELERAPCDVVVSDMRMPGMDGAALLGHVRALAPGGDPDRPLGLRPSARSSCAPPRSRTASWPSRATWTSSSASLRAPARCAR